ncbi:MAG TPA: gamma-glutamyl-gamma-aminobutyrate hydrolase family protein [Myxococcota bacterium]|nr:gamma-glutamyl-gamma-aminobutyrate hydrolase family protein [Myxococcota bacterium]HRY93005.1 gamma-glutamyl-gamma-aminobutyrate hydrolase family protein [Myxococcota bacterium]HSA21957.1 gamma-glutamyl-gamma-aminobutyrate hydrolase family protein [Myxococcota bacterium]
MSPARALIWLLLALGAAPASAEEPAPVLLWTHPSPDELAQAAALMRRGWLPADVRLVGVYHADEWGAGAYLDALRAREATGLERLELRALACLLGRDEPGPGCDGEIDRLFGESDGLVLAGGPDIPPRLYGQATRLTTSIQDPPRHLFELALVRRLAAGPRPSLAARPGYPVLAICLGMQTLNVALGGDLVQDIPSQLYGLSSLEAIQAQPEGRQHRSAAAQLHPEPEIGWGVAHPLRLGRHPLARALDPGGAPRVLSIHHQSLGRLGRELQVWATSADGRVPEGVVHARFPGVVGVQFHPEKAVPWDPELVYRSGPGAAGVNAIYPRMGADARTRAFHEALWRRFVEALRASARARLAARPSALAE